MLFPTEHFLMLFPVLFFFFCFFNKQADFIKVAHPDPLYRDAAEKTCIQIGTTVEKYVYFSCTSLILINLEIQSNLLICCELPIDLHHRLNTNVELCKSLKDLLCNEEVMAKLDPETRCVFSAVLLCLCNCWSNFVSSSF